MTADTQGFQQPDSFGAEYNAYRFVVNSLISQVRTGTPCKILAVTNSGGVSPVGTVDLQPLVNQISGSGLTQSEGALKAVPYFRLQGGANAIIIDPQVGDIGYAMFADKDTSSVKKNKAQSNPGSGRQFDVSDGWFLPCFLGAAPTQYIQFNQDGVTILSPTKIQITAPIVNVNASTSVTMTTPIVTMTGSLHVEGHITSDGDVTGQGTSLHTHVHGGVTSGGSDTTGPI